MHELADLRTGLCNNSFYRASVAHQWGGPYCWQTWTVDWMDRHGHWSSIIVDGSESAPYRRPENSWHIYAPNVGYKHMDEHKIENAESAWFFFTVPTPIKALQRPLS